MYTNESTYWNIGLYRIEFLNIGLSIYSHQMSNEGIWYDNPHVLFDGKRMLDFWPQTNGSLTQKVNSTTRFLIYSCILLAVFTRKPKYMILCAVLVAILGVAHKTSVQDDAEFMANLTGKQNTEFSSESATHHGTDVHQTQQPRDLSKRDYMKFANYLMSGK